MASTDGAMSVVPAMLAERLGWPQVTLASVVETQGDQVRIKRDGDTATEVIGAAFPLVLSVTDQSGEARYPSFKGIMAAKKKPLETLSLADIGVDAGSVGLSVAWSEVAETTARPPRSAGEVVKDENGSGATALAEFLAAKQVHLSSVHPSSVHPSRREFGREHADMSEVLVLVDHADGAVKKPTYELLTIAKRLGEPSAVFIGSGAQGAEVAEKVKAYGAEKVYVVDDAQIKGFLVAPEGRGAAAAGGASHASGAAAILIPSTTEGKEIAGRLAIKLESGLITDAIDVAADGTTTQSVFAGNYTVTAKVTHGTPIITVKPNSAAPQESAGAGAVEEFAATISDAAKGAQIVASQPRQASGRPELTEAAIVVAGGRGVGSQENFAVIEALADALGAAVGASRAAVDSGWMPHSYQIGQTGKTVSPQLYVANGISGAIQHRAGMQTSKTIVAVNKDEEAPIFELVDFGVVGDLHTVLPALTEQVNQRKG